MQYTENTPFFGTVSRWIHQFIPGIPTLLQYKRTDFNSDLLAGISVAAVCLPVGIAYAEIAGVPAVYGIYAAIVPLLVYAIFGSSRQLIIGPDAATCLMVASAVAPLAEGDPQRYMELMISITIMTGLFHVILGCCRFGFIANFLSHPILVGYLNGVALIIFVGQLPKLFGYRGNTGDFFGKLLEFMEKIGSFHFPSLALGAAAFAILLILRRWAPRIPAALIVTVCGIAAVQALELQSAGVAVLGSVPAGFPSFHIPTFDPTRAKILMQDAAGIALISFISGILTAKSFASRNRYNIDANQELIAFGACNIFSGLVQGFPVTGADSRTAVNDAMQGKTQLTGIIAGGAMLFFLLFLTTPLAILPKAALAAIIAVSSLGLFDWRSLQELYTASRRELTFSLVTTAGVLYFDVLPAVFLAIGLTLLWLLLAAAKPHDAVLGQVPGIGGFHNIADHPNAVTMPGLLLYRFDGDFLFFNIDYYKNRLLEEIARAAEPVEWVVIDASPINVLDITALHKLIELRQELEGRGIRLFFARVKGSLWSFFNPSWIARHSQYNREIRYSTLGSAVEAFEQRNQTAR
jgi:high affinity sulfate transporter 1